MPSPRRIYKFLSTAEFAALRAELVSASVNGQFISTSEQGMSGTKNRVDLETAMFEYSAEAAIRGVDGLTPRIQSVQSVLPGGSVVPQNDLNWNQATV